LSLLSAVGFGSLSSTFLSPDASSLYHLQPGARSPQDRAYHNLYIAHNVSDQPSYYPQTQTQQHTNDTYRTHNIVSATHIFWKVSSRTLQQTTTASLTFNAGNIASGSHSIKVYICLPLIIESSAYTLLQKLIAPAPRSIPHTPLEAPNTSSQVSIATTVTMISHNYNPDARNFNPNGAALNGQGNSTPQQVRSPPSPYLEARLLNLEVAHGDLRGEVDTLKDLYHDLYNSFGRATRDAAPTHTNSPQSHDLAKSRQSAMQFKQELELLSREVRESVNGNANDQKASSGSTPKANRSLPPHARAASVASNDTKKSLPPHLRGGKQLATVNGNA
jgi:hypothetical protein